MEVEYNPVLHRLANTSWHVRKQAEANTRDEAFALHYKRPKDVPVRVREPFMVRGMQANAGDIVTVPADDAEWLIAIGRAAKV